MDIIEASVTPPVQGRTRRPTLETLPGDFVPLSRKKAPSIAPENNLRQSGHLEGKLSTDILAQQQALREKQKAYEEAVKELDKDRRSFSDEYSKFQRKKDLHQGRVEQFEADRENFELEKRQFGFQKQIFEETKLSLTKDQERLKTEEGLLLQKLELVLKEQESLLKERKEFLNEKKNWKAQVQNDGPDYVAAQLTTELKDYRTQIDKFIQNEDALHAAVESLTLKLQLQEQNERALREELNTQKSTKNKTHADVEKLIDDWSATQQEWKKREQRLNAQNKNLTETMKHFIMEREQLNRDRQTFESLKLSFIDQEIVPAFAKEERWQDKNWVLQETKKLAQDRQKIVLVKRYTEQERERLSTLKKRLEITQLQHDKLQLENAKLRARLQMEGGGSKKKKKDSSDGITKKKPVKLNLNEAVDGQSHESIMLLSPRTGSISPEREKRTPPQQQRPQMSQIFSSPPEKVASPATSPRNDRSPRSGSGKKVKKSESREREREEVLGASSDDSGAQVVSYGDVFNLSNLSLLQMSRDTLVRIVKKGEEQDWETLEEDDETIIKISLRCALRRLGAIANDYEFNSTMLMIHDYFIDAITLLKVFILFYRAQSLPLLLVRMQPPPGSSDDKDVVEQIATKKYLDRIIGMIKMWMGYRFETLTVNEGWRTLLVKFFLFLSSPAGNADHLTELRQAWNFLEETGKEFLEGKHELTTLITGPANTMTFLDIDPSKFAEQLTLEEQRDFQNIELTNYYQKSWENLSDTENTLSRFMFRFDVMTNWFVSLILSASSEPQLTPVDPAERAKVISHLIAVMQELKTINNYNSLMQIMTALNRSHITRLKKTWALVPKADHNLLEKLQTFMSPSNKYASYRDRLDVIEENQPCIPYHSLLLRDLSIIEGMNEQMTDSDVYFETMNMLSGIFQRLQDFRCVLYDFPQLTQIQLFIYNKKILTPSDISKFSTDDFVRRRDSKSSKREKLTKSNSTPLGALPPSTLGRSNRVNKESKSAQTARDPPSGGGAHHLSNGPKSKSDDKIDFNSRPNRNIPSMNRTSDKTRRPSFDDLSVDPDLALSFRTFLKKDRDRNALEAWHKVKEFNSKNYGKSAAEFLVWQETGEDILSKYFQEDGDKFFNHSADVEKLENLLCEGEIKPQAFAPLLPACASLLAPAWKKFSEK